MLFRSDQFLRAKAGEIDVMIGPRSALFTPFSQIGVMIIDEEHEGAYKSETVPRYDAREVAAVRAKKHGASLILGSATPSVEGGIYKIDDRLIQDTKAAKGGLYHSSMLGVQMADVLHKKYGGIMIMMNPPIVDELCDLARVTGVDGVYRRAVCHALNLKETSRRHAISLGFKRKILIENSDTVSFCLCDSDLFGYIS